MPHRKPTSLVLPAIVVLVLLGAYVGAYCWAVEPHWAAPSYPRLEYDPDLETDDLDERERQIEKFEVSQERWRLFFAPIHWLDRKCRPIRWERPVFFNRGQIL